MMEPSLSPENWSVDEVCAWLDTLKLSAIEEIKESFRDNDVDGNYLLDDDEDNECAISNDTLKADLNVEKAGDRRKILVV